MYIISRGAIKKKNVPKSGKSPKGGGVSAGDQKVHNSNFGLFDNGLYYNTGGLAQNVSFDPD